LLQAVSFGSVVGRGITPFVKVTFSRNQLRAEIRQQW
jgi:hypothetical protein